MSEAQLPPKEPSLVMAKAGGLFSSHLVRILVAFISIALATRLLGSHNFGLFSFMMTVPTNFGLFLDLGIGAAAGRLIALTSDRKEQAGLCGAALLLYLAVIPIFVGLILALSGLIEEIFHMEVSTTLKIAAIPAIAFLVQGPLRDLLQGYGSITLLGIQNAGPWCVFLGSIGLLHHLGRLTVETMFLAYASSFLVVMLGIILALRPTFRGIGRELRQVLRETRRFGLNVYASRVVGTGTFQLDTPLIAYFTQDASVVGYYSLAKAIASPISLFSQSLAIVHFRAYAARARLSLRAIGVNMLWLVLSCTGLALLARVLVATVNGREYVDGVVPLLYIWIVVAFIQGLYQLPNVFLRASGQGRALRNSTIWFAIANIASNCILVPLAGAAGASIASGIANFVWLVSCTFYYRRVVSSWCQDPGDC